MRKSFVALLMVLCVGGVTRPVKAQEFVPASKTSTSVLPGADEFAKEKAAFRPGQFRAADGTTLPYRMLSPAELTAGMRYPLVLVLHGSGAIGTDNSSQLNRFAVGWAEPALRTRFPAFVVAPQFSARSADYSESKADALLASQAGAPLGTALELVDQLVRSNPIDPQRIYVVGFSMGASAGWHSLLLRPDLFAGAVLISGVPPERSVAAQLAKTPVLITHGNADPENPFPPDRAMFAALQAIDGNKARFREYDNLPHAVPADMLATDPAGDWWRVWLFAQHR